VATIKLCGMVRRTDLQLASGLGADFVGMIVDFPRSPRSLSVSEAAQLASGSRLPVVPVLVDPTVEKVAEVVERVRPFAIQLSGHEPEALVEAVAQGLEVEIWKTIHLSSSSSVTAKEQAARVDEYANAGATRILLDSETREMPGGTGRSVDWRLVRRISSLTLAPLVLSGGLKPDNIGEAIRETGLRAVDVSSGIERAPGIKDPDLMSGFVEGARRAFASTDEPGGS